jgi:hypothetical protein
MAVKDGGSAFPGSKQTNESGMVIRFAEPGMTLRDWFAGQVLQGWFSQAQLRPSIDTDPSRYANQIAADCYLMANAMLRAREV